MGIAERKLRHKEELRTLILDTAWQYVKKEGWQALSIRKIADSIEYSVPVIYDHFANKDAIILEFAKQGFAKLIDKLRTARDKSADPAEQLRLIADAYWQFAFANKEYYQLMFGLGITCCEVGKVLPEKIVFRELVMNPISEILVQSPRKADDACLKYHTFWSVLHGLISIKMMVNSDVSDELNKLVMVDAVNGFIKNLQE